MVNEMKKLLEKLDIKPKNIDLYEQAFIHTSYQYEHNLENSYERLEFLGDAIVDLVISDYLYKTDKYKEGEMTKIRASYVCENALYEYAIKLDFPSYIKVGKGENKSGGNHKKAIVADVFEAFMGAIYLDLGYEKAKEIALKIIIPYIEDNHILLFNDYKSVLQEALQTTKNSFEYKILDEKGPAHNKEFKVALIINNITYGIGKGSSKKEAEQVAAQEALKKLAKDK